MLKKSLFPLVWVFLSEFLCVYFYIMLNTIISYVQVTVFWSTLLLNMWMFLFLILNSSSFFTWYTPLFYIVKYRVFRLVRIRWYLIDNKWCGFIFLIVDCVWIDFDSFNLPFFVPILTWLMTFWIFLVTYSINTSRCHL